MTYAGYLVLFVVAGTYVVWPGFYSNISDLVVLAWGAVTLEIRRTLLLWSLKRQWEAADRDYQRFIRDLERRERPEKRRDE